MKTALATPEQPQPRKYGAQHTTTCTYCTSRDTALYPAGWYCTTHKPQPRPGWLGLSMRREPKA